MNSSACSSDSGRGGISRTRSSEPDARMFVSFFGFDAFTAWTQTFAWMAIFFFASAAASSAYLTASEIFPLETRALAIAAFYALGTLTSAVSFLVIFTALMVILILQARQRRHGSDAGKGML